MASFLLFSIALFILAFFLLMASCLLPSTATFNLFVFPLIASNNSFFFFRCAAIFVQTKVLKRCCFMEFYIIKPRIGVLHTEYLLTRYRMLLWLIFATVGLTTHPISVRMVYISLQHPGDI